MGDEDMKSLMSQLAGLQDSFAEIENIEESKGSGSGSAADEVGASDRVALSAVQKVVLVAQKHGFKADINELFEQVTFSHPDGIEITWTWTSSPRTTNQFDVNVWDAAEAGVVSIKNATLQHIEGIFSNPRHQKDIDYSK